MTDIFQLGNDLHFDHVIHAVHAPDQLCSIFEQTFGLCAIQGGEHVSWGTYNSLAYFGLSYVEWLGIRDEEKASKFSEECNVRAWPNTLGG